MNREQIFWLCIFGVVTALGYGAVGTLLARRAARLKERLQQSPDLLDEAPSKDPGSFLTLLNRVGQTAGKAFQPRTREEQSALRRRLGTAGIYSTSAVHLISGAKAICLAGGFFGGYLLGQAINNMLMGIAIGGLVGFLLPSMWLNMRIRANQQSLEEGLPDALDLMVVCVESGLTLDAAMQRVGREIALAHPNMAKELAITHLETQMGLARSDALRNLSRRTGSAPLQSLSAMLIQAERFGTGIAQALRVHAESLRLKRHYAAEAKAAQASVKMTFPLVLCIFPALLIVVGGPAFILVMRQMAR